MIIPKLLFQLLGSGMSYQLRFLEVVSVLVSKCLLETFLLLFLHVKKALCSLTGTVYVGVT